MMLTLKDYQERAKTSLRLYFEECLRIGNADTAFYEVTKTTLGQGVGTPYRAVKELPGLPYVCLRLPTGGGKTLLACHAVNVAAKSFLQTDNAVVLWLVPSNAIREQTLRTLQDTVKTPEAKAAIERLYQKGQGAACPPRVPAPKPPLRIPVLTVREGTLFEQFEEQFLAVPWQLASGDGRLDDKEYPSARADGRLGEVDITAKGKVETTFLEGLHAVMAWLNTDALWTDATLIRWLDRNIPHDKWPEITQDESVPFVTGVILKLISERGFKLTDLVHDRFRLARAVEAKIQSHRLGAQAKAYGEFLAPDFATPLSVTPEVCFQYSEEYYTPQRFFYKGGCQWRSTISVNLPT